MSGRGSNALPSGRFMYVLVLVCGFLVMLTLLHNWRTARHVGMVFAPLVDAAAESRNLVTRSHVILEEMIVGARPPDWAMVQNQMDSAAWYVQAMLEGGTTPRKQIIPPKDTGLRFSTKRLGSQVEALREISSARLEAIGDSALTAVLFDEYHDSYHRMLISLEQLDSGLHRTMNSEMNAFRLTQTALIAICLCATLSTIMLLRRFQRRRRRDWEALTRLNQRLEEDIGRRELVEQALRTREGMFRAITENSADIIIITGADGRCKYVTPSVERLNGYTADKVLGAPPDEFVHPDDLPSLRTTLEKAIENPTRIVRIDEFRIRTEGDGWLFLEAVVTNQLQVSGVEGLVVTCRDITERKRSLEDLRDSEHRFRLLFEHANDAVFLHTVEGEIVDVNQQACTLLGYSRKELIGRSLASLTSTDHGADARTGPAEVVKQGNTRFTSRLHRADGAEVSVEVSAALVDPEQNLIQGVATDITERLKYEKQLRENHERLAEAHRIARMGSWEYDLESGKIHLSDELLRLVDQPSDYSPDLGTVATRFSPDHRSCFEKAISRAIREGEEFDFEARMTTVAGRDLWVRMMGYPVRVDGRTHRLTGVVQDITDLKEASERLRESEQRLSLLFRHTPVAVIEWDTDFRVTDWNPAAESIFGYTRQEALGKHPSEIILTPGWKLQADIIMEQLLTTSGGSRATNENLTKDGRRIVCDWYNTPFCDKSGDVVGVASMAVDVTARNRYQAALEDYTARLARSNRELQDFASVASHDLQEPLRKVRAFSDRLVAVLGRDLPPKAADYLDRMQNAANRMQVLIDDLLTLARVTSRAKPFEAVDLNQVTNEVLGDLEIRIEELSGRVETANLPTIEADPLQMRQLLQNLIANALKFHRLGQAPIVNITCRSGETDDQGAPPDACHIQVRDNGIGFDPQYAERIFAIFHRLHGRSEYDGTGIGLSVCRKIVERHGGVISANAVPGEGAVFTVTLPLSQQQGETADDYQLQEHHHPAGRG